MDCEDDESTESYIFYYGRAPISWSSNKQDPVAPSSTVAVYVTLDGVEKPTQIPICMDSDNTEKKGRKHAPPKRKSVDGWGEVQREKEPQYVNKTQCSHCDIEDLPVRNCYHLLKEPIYED
ncbi:uncharacterized protein PGRI_050280 [Penicillium griseofulvum]|uniref:Uncharacterized protein n=1 Tax=Penicillium patulum TaxID=5078 RepID=A0A135LB18_PENPA|nr:uncharacterized protein PGRI_050280 [Penicillium griseofulvum]KXG46172.1 hypothetical protein PGRI_050280 [Penicillium griseofulvum]